MAYPVPAVNDSARASAWHALAGSGADELLSFPPVADLDVSGLPSIEGEYAWTLRSWPGSVQMVRTDIVGLNRKMSVLAETERLDMFVADDSGTVSDGFTDDFRDYVAAVAAGRVSPAGKTRGKVSGWSYKSRLNLLRTVSQLDTSGVWGMMTLTLPGDWASVTPTPADCRRMFRAFTKRFVREYGDIPMIWKFETQRRGAPHFHVGFQVPEGVKRGDLREWVASAWHSIVSHNGKACDLDVCRDIAGLLHGTRVDSAWSECIGGKSLASYFAKHGVWSSKEYQNTSPGVVLRSAAVLVSILSGVPLPARFWHDDNDDPGMYETRKLEFGPDSREAAWSEVLDVVEAWEYPGRWWGYLGITKPLPLERTINADEAEALRLIMRKVFTRRTTRLVALDDSSGTPRIFVQRRSLRSLRGSAGWYVLSSDPEKLLRFMLDEASKLARIPVGPARARWLAARIRSGRWLAADSAEGVTDVTSRIPVICQ